MFAEGRALGAGLVGSADEHWLSNVVSKGGTKTPTKEGLLK
jgi:hypothetical protein